MIGIVYKAIDCETEKIVKIGSTIKPLKYRASSRCYLGCRLEPIRVDEYEDSSFGLLHLRIRETQEISKYKTWHNLNLGGRNILNPTRVWMSELDDSVMRSYAGILGGIKAFKLYGNPATKKGLIKAGKISGQKNTDSGWASELGKKYGGRHFEHLINYRTSENQSKRGKLGIKKRFELDPDFPKRAMHNRWHIKKGKISSACKFCKAVS